MFSLFFNNKIGILHSPCKRYNIMRKRDISLSPHIKFPPFMRTSDDDMSCVKFTLYPQHLLSPINITLITHKHQATYYPSFDFTLKLLIKTYFMLLLQLLFRRQKPKIMKLEMIYDVLKIY